MQVEGVFCFWGSWEQRPGTSVRDTESSRHTETGKFHFYNSVGSIDRNRFFYILKIDKNYFFNTQGIGNKNVVSRVERINLFWVTQ